MKPFHLGIIIAVVGMGIWNFVQKFDLGRKPSNTITFAQMNIPTEHKPLIDPAALAKTKSLQADLKAASKDVQHVAVAGVTSGLKTQHPVRPTRIAKSPFQLMKDPLPARGPLTTPELALELELARLNELRAQSTEANNLVADIMVYFEKLRTNKKLSKRFSNLPTDENGQAIFDEAFGEQMIEDKKVLAKWKRLMQLSRQGETPEYISTL